jgi:hypothetical protein
MLPITDAAAIFWQGSAGAQSYVVERAPSSNGPWKVVGQSVDDANVQYRPLFNDESVKPGESYYYRATARNAAGLSPPSEPSGPVRVIERALIDECCDRSKLASFKGAVEATTGDDRRRREDMSRLALPPGSSVVYKAAGPIASCKAVAFLLEKNASLSVNFSTDGETFLPVKATLDASPAGKGDYNYLPRVALQSRAVPPEARYLRIESLGGGTELSWVEIRYGRIGEGIPSESHR